MSNKKISFGLVLSSIGAFAAYAIGSGFATGQEVLQYFASWGVPGFLVAIVCSAVIVCIDFTSMVHAGYEYQDELQKDSDYYRFYGGKIIGSAIDYFSVFLVFLVLLAVYAGCGATINQYFGVPEYVGTVAMGIVCCIVVMLGLKRIVQVLGFMGVVFIIFIVGFGLYSLLTNQAGLVATSARLDEYVADEKILQAGIFGIYNPVWSGLNYGGVVLITSFPFVVALGRRNNNGREAAISGFNAGLWFYLPALFACIAILSHLDYIAAYGQQVPMLAAFTEAFPAISGIYTAILLLGIFTTVTGYSWFVTGRFSEEGTTRNKVLAVAVTLGGIVGGAVLPFNVILNRVFPVTGLVGMALTACIIVKEIRLRMEKK